MGVIVLQGEAQAFLIENLLLDKLGAEEMQQRRLICGNPYSFQGDERDVIFMSMVAATNERIGPFTRPADQRRFNVAASRAKDQVWLFHSVTTNDLSEQCLRRMLLNYFQNFEAIVDHGLGQNINNLHLLAKSANRIIEKAPAPFESWFELDVALKIADRSYKVIPQYPVVENKRIDLVVEGESTRLAVECDGDHWHGLDQYQKDMERQRMLERCGWTFFRVREAEFNANPLTTLNPLWAKIDSMNIQPLTKFAYDKAMNKPDKDIERKKERTEPEKQEAVYKKKQKEPQTIKEDPKDIQDALKLKPSKIRKAIIKALKDRPNHTCVKRFLPTFILKDWQILTRGNPRKSFERRVNQAISYLEKNSILKVYKISKNVRVKLIESISEQVNLPFDMKRSDTRKE